MSGLEKGERERVWSCVDCPELHNYTHTRSQMWPKRHGHTGHTFDRSLAPMYRACLAHDGDELSM